MERAKLLELLNNAVRITAVRYNINNIVTTSKPKKYEQYVEKMFNFLNHPEFHHFTIRKK